MQFHHIPTLCFVHLAHWSKLYFCVFALLILINWSKRYECMQIDQKGFLNDLKLLVWVAVLFCFLKCLAQGVKAICNREIHCSSLERVWSQYCSQTKQQREKILAVLGFEPGTVGWDARMLPLCYAAPLSTLTWEIVGDEPTTTDSFKAGL